MSIFDHNWQASQEGTKRDAEVRVCFPLLLPHKQIRAELIIHHQHSIFGIPPSTVNFIDLGLGKAGFLCQTVMVLLQPMLAETFAFKGCKYSMCFRRLSIKARAFIAMLRFVVMRSNGIGGFARVVTDATKITKSNDRE